MAASGTIAALRAKVGELEAEVARLKKLLATKNGPALAAPPARTADDLVATMGVGRANGHAQFCGCIGCRAGA